MLEAAEGKIGSVPIPRKSSQPMTEYFALPILGLLHLAMGAMLIYPQWEALTGRFPWSMDESGEFGAGGAGGLGGFGGAFGNHPLAGLL
jgi:hypothetical protein